MSQPLAARGFFVLQVDDIDYESLQGDARKEVDRAMEIYRSGIEYLDHRGLIDVRRVGVIGWSHTCFDVKYALSHTDMFAAASLGEGEDGGYFSSSRT
jgi:hypothetical protein